MDRIVSRAVTYVVISIVLITSFFAAVFVLGQVLGAAAGRSHVADVGATLVAVAVTAPSYRRVQSAVDRRFNRRRYEVLQRVRDYVRDPAPAISLENLLRDAFGDPRTCIAYSTESREQWVTADGHPTHINDEAVVIDRHGRRIAGIGFDPAVTALALVLGAAEEAAAELGPPCPPVTSTARIRRSSYGTRGRSRPARERAQRPATDRQALRGARHSAMCAPRAIDISRTERAGVTDQQKQRYPIG